MADKNKKFTEKMRKKRDADEGRANTDERMKLDSSLNLLPPKDILIRFKLNHQLLPLLILPDFRILVFTQCSIYRRIVGYIRGFMEALHRPQHIHQYKITKNSMYTARVLGYTPEDVIGILEKLCRNLDGVPKALKLQIVEGMGKQAIRLELIQDKYYIYGTEEIGKLTTGMVGSPQLIEQERQQRGWVEEIQREMEVSHEQHEHENENDENENKYDEENVEVQKMEVIKQNFGQIVDDGEIKTNKIDQFYQRGEGETVLHKKVSKTYRYVVLSPDYFPLTSHLLSLNYPILHEYSFAKECPLSISISLNPDVQLRYYQERALKAVFGGESGRGRSGIIILPCGAGKSLIGVATVARVSKKAIILCESSTSAQQWRQEFLRWTDLPRSRIIVLTGRGKQKLTDLSHCSILITTYTMVTFNRNTPHPSLKLSLSAPWGICICDQVHKLPASTFRQSLHLYHFHQIIGLTATPYRQDQLISNLQYMIGPKLYEEQWQELVEGGYIARVYCVEIPCSMSQKWRDIYKKCNQAQLIHTANPEKFRVLQYLIKKHTQCGDKILVFCDRPKILQYYAKLLKHPFIHGNVSEGERLQFYSAFKTVRSFNVLFISRVGDTAIDLPCANVGIQIGMHFGSRRQEVQRMGRIMRSKQTGAASKNEQYNAFWYTLTSMDTKEVIYSRARAKCLISQGFQHQILSSDDIKTSNMRLVQFDEHQYLMYVLAEHQEGDLLLQGSKNIKKNREKTQIRQGGQEDNYQYYYEEEG